MTSKLKTLKDVKKREIEKLECIAGIFLEETKEVPRKKNKVIALVKLMKKDIEESMESVRTELGLKRIVKLEGEKEHVNPLEQSFKDVKIEELMEVFNISWGDIKKFKEGSK